MNRELFYKTRPTRWLLYLAAQSIVSVGIILRQPWICASAAIPLGLAVWLLWESRPWRKVKP